MADPRPRPWELKVHTVYGGYQPVWEKWVWDAMFQQWEPVYAHVGDRRVLCSTREMCEEAIAGLKESELVPPSW